MKKILLLFGIFLFLPLVQADEVMVTYINQSGMYNVSFSINISSYNPCRRPKETKSFDGSVCEFFPNCPMDNPNTGSLRMICDFPITTNVSDVRPNLPVDVIDKCNDQLDKCEVNKASIESGLTNVLNTERIIIIGVVSVASMIYFISKRIGNKLLLKWWGR